MTRAQRMTHLKPLAKVQPELPGLAREPRNAFGEWVDAVASAAGAAATIRKGQRLAELEAYEASEAANDHRRKGVFAAGDVVVFTAQHLWAALCGLQAADIAAEWTVQECSCELCALGNHVCTTEWSEWFEGRGGWRHLAKASIRHRGQWVDECPLSMQPLIRIPNAANLRVRSRAEWR